MSYQIVCDNCGATKQVDTRSSYPKPDGWETLLERNTSLLSKHLCPECSYIKESVRIDIQNSVLKAQEEALAARRNK